MKVRWKTFFIDMLATAGGMLIVHYLITQEIQLESLFTAILTGIIFALTFRRIFRRFTKYHGDKLLKQITVELEADERLLKESGASHFKGKEAVGGKLTLTNKRLIFKSHSYNIQNHLQDFKFSEISALKQSSMRGEVHNILTFETANNELHQFLIDTPSEWIKEIGNAKAA